VLLVHAYALHATGLCATAVSWKNTLKRHWTSAKHETNLTSTFTPLLREGRGSSSPKRFQNNLRFTAASATSASCKTMLDQAMTRT